MNLAREFLCTCGFAAELLRQNLHINREVFSKDGK
jgi:hypothetical protein